ncbi:MAG: hypothetical protein AAFR76_07645, partial [Planctomycetota bacterium]
AIDLNRRIPGKLNDLIMQCLEVAPEDRPEMPDVVDQLELIHAMLKAGVKDRSGEHRASKA